MIDVASQKAKLAWNKTILTIYSHFILNLSNKNLYKRIIVIESKENLALI